MQNKKRIYLSIFIILAVTLTIEKFFAHPHFSNIWNTLPGADIIIGFAGAWLLIFVSKIVISSLLQRDNGYYEDGGEDDAE